MVDIALATGHYSVACRGDLHRALALFDAHHSGAAEEGAGGDRNGGGSVSATAWGLDLILAADTFIYVGGLGAVFRQARRCLRPRGLLAFSVEDLDKSPMRVARPPGDAAGTAHGHGHGHGSAPADGATDADGELVGAVPGWGAQLLSSARFAHAHAYIAALAEAHGFREAAGREGVLRNEGGVALPGRLYVLERT